MYAHMFVCSFTWLLTCGLMLCSCTYTKFTCILTCLYVGSHAFLHIDSYMCSCEYSHMFSCTRSPTNSGVHILAHPWAPCICTILLDDLGWLLTVPPLRPCTVGDSPYGSLNIPKCVSPTCPIPPGPFEPSRTTAGGGWAVKQVLGLKWVGRDPWSSSS